MLFVRALFFFLLLPLLPARRARAAGNQSHPTDSIRALNGSCVSLVLQDFYSNRSGQSEPSTNPCNSENKLPGIFRLGASTNISKEQLINNNKLRIGVPKKKGFYEFMKVYNDTKGKTKTKVTGYPVDVFEAVMKSLPYSISYDFFPFESNIDVAHYYDELISQVYFKKFDAVVGDTTITANRSDFVEFTYPYMDAGVSMIVPTQGDDTMSPWWFLEPLTMNLWLTTLAFAVLKGILVWIFECEKNPEFQGSPSKIIGKVLSFSVSTFVFAAHEKLESNYSRFIASLWTFLVFILVTAYAANLTSMLTVDKLQPIITDIESLKSNEHSVGYQSGSFVFELLKRNGFNESKLKAYATVKEYKDALDRGSKNGGVSAIMDEIPYIRVFLKTHCRQYTMAGRINRTGGFGFVFPRGSAMVPDISRAIMNLSVGDKMFNIEKKWFGDEKECVAPGTPIANRSLQLFSLRTIYIIAGVGSAMALSIYFIRFKCRCRRHEVVKETLQTDGPLWKVLSMSQHFKQMDTSINSPRVTLGPENTIHRAQHEPPSQIFAIELIPNQLDGEDQHVSGQRSDESEGRGDLSMNLVPTRSKRKGYKSYSS